MKLQKFISLTVIVGIIAATTWGCLETGSDDDSNDGLLLGLVAFQQQAAAAAEAAKQCETAHNNSSPSLLSSLLELCTPTAGRGRHFRFENVGMTANNGYLNLLIGYGTYTANTNTTEFPQVAGFGGPFSPTTTSGDGRWRIFFGKSTSCNRAWFAPGFSGISNNANITLHELFMTSAVSTTYSAGTCPAAQGGAAQASGSNWGPSTICMDVTKGASGSSPRLTVWATGRNGADCANLSTLTDATKIYEKRDWTQLVETRDDRNYVYLSNDSTTFTKVVVRSEPAIKN